MENDKKQINVLLNTILLNQINNKQNTSSLYSYRKRLESLLETYINKDDDMKERNYTKFEDFWVCIYELLKCFHIYDNYYDINKKYLTEYSIKTDNKVFDFNISEILNLSIENDDELGSIIKERQKGIDIILGNLKN